MGNEYLAAVSGRILRECIFMHAARHCSLASMETYSLCDTGYVAWERQSQPKERCNKERSCPPHHRYIRCMDFFPTLKQQAINSLASRLRTATCLFRLGDLLLRLDIVANSVVISMIFLAGACSRKHC